MIIVVIDHCQIKAVFRLYEATKLRQFPVYIPGPKCQHLADIVAKRFWTSGSATFIQDEPLTPMLISNGLLVAIRLLRPSGHLPTQYRPHPEAPALDVLQVRSGSIHLLNRT